MQADTLEKRIHHKMNFMLAYAIRKIVSRKIEKKAANSAGRRMIQKT